MSGERVTSWTKLGRVVRDERLRQAISQQQLADRAGVARSWLARVEAGHRGAALEPLLRLLDVLGIDMTLRARGADSAPAQRGAEPETVGPDGVGASRTDHPAIRARRDAAAARRRAWEVAGKAGRR